MALKLQAQIGMDSSGFEAGLNKIKNLAATAFGAYGIQQAIEKTIHRADELVTASQRLGVAVEDLQVLREAAKEASTDLDAVAKGFENIDAARAKALGGDQKLLAQFSRLGISVGDLKSKTAAELFTGPLSQAAQTRNQGDLGPILKDIVGKPFRDLMAVMQTDFKGLEGTMRRFGLIMDTETAVKLDMVGDEFQLLSQVIITQLAPALVWLAEHVYSLFGKLAGFAGSLGGATSNMSGGQILKLISDLLNPFGPDPKELVKRLNIPAAALESQHAEQRFMGPLEELKRKIEQDAYRLKHPTPQVFEAEPTGEPKDKRPKMHRLHETTDALIRVGNFLGTGRNPLISVLEKQTVYLREIAHNTRHITGLKSFRDYDMTHMPVA